jgi:putative ABC transport system substrate-binding protein
MELTIVPDGPTSIYPRTADLINALVPALRRLGTVYNPGEANSLTNRVRISEEATRLGWELIERTVGGPEDVEPTARALLAQDLQAIWISKDRIMTGQPQRLIELAHAAGVPVFASDAGTVERFNAVATVSVSFEDLGKFVGRRVLEHLRGSRVSDMPISTVEDTHVFLSSQAVNLLRLTIPDSIRQQAITFGAAVNPVPAVVSRGPNTTLVLVLMAVTLVVLAGVARSLRRK